MPKPTIHDVARESGVSISSVSNALNGKKKVSEETLLRIEEAVSRLGYVADPGASSLKSGSTHVIGLIVPSIDSAFFPAVISGLQSSLETRGYIINFYATGFDARMEEKYLSALLSSKVDGIILDSVSLDESRLAELAHLGTAKKRVPVIALERDLTHLGLTSVFSDNFVGGRLAAEHLVSRSVTKPAHILGRELAPWSADRLSGFRAGLADAGLDLLESRIASGNFTLDGGFDAAMRLMQIGDIDGIFAANDLSAVGAMRALRELGRKIPDDVALIGFDNTYVTSLTTPTVSTIDVPKLRLGELAGQAVLDAISKPGVERLELPLTLIARESTSLIKNPSTTREQC